MDDNVKIEGSVLKNARKSLGYSLEEVANLVGSSAATLSRYEQNFHLTGQLKKLDMNLIMKLVQLYRLDMGTVQRTDLGELIRNAECIFVDGQTFQINPIARERILNAIKKEILWCQVEKIIPEI